MRVGFSKRYAGFKNRIEMKKLSFEDDGLLMLAFSIVETLASFRHLPGGRAKRMGHLDSTGKLAYARCRPAINIKWILRMRDNGGGGVPFLTVGGETTIATRRRRRCGGNSKISCSAAQATQTPGTDLERESF